MESTMEIRASDGLHHTNQGHGTAVDPLGLKIAIVGGGIGALTAAIYLQRQGHEVTVLEQPSPSDETGDLVQLTPNLNGLLRRLGVFGESINATLIENVG